MTALTITAASVAYVSGPVATDQVAGEAFAAGAAVYYNSSTGKWLKAQCDGTVDEAGATKVGLALASADAAGARISVALPDAIVSVGTGTAGVVYAVGATAGTLVPIADLVSTNKVTVAAVGIGSSKLRLARIYDAGAVL
jgi:hypothetical protein